jgi:hypothetical protein
MLEKLLAKRHINSLDLSSVRGKLVEKLGWTIAKAEAVELEYKRFLYALTHKSPGVLISPPTNDVDEFWHQHILDTRKYREDCQKIFGHYVDHTPGLSVEEQANADARRRRVYSDNDIDSIAFDPPNGSSTGSSETCGGGGGESHHAHGTHSTDTGHHGSDHGSDGGAHDGGGDGGGGGDGCGGDGGCGGG